MFGSAFGGVEGKAFNDLETTESSGVTGLFAEIPFHRQGDENLASGVLSSTRASDATYIDPTTGFMKTATIDEPRFELVNGTVQRLIEEGSTNSIPALNWRRPTMWSTGWGGANVAIVQQTNGDLAIDGVANKEVIITDNSPKAIACYRNVTFTDSLAIDRATVLIKKNSATNIVLLYLLMNGGTTVAKTVYIDTVTGLFTGNGSVRDSGTHWLVSITVQRNNTGNSNMYLLIYPASKALLTDTLNDATLTGSVTVDYPMIELNANPQASTHSLVPGGTTRVADVVSISNANIPPLVNGATFVVRSAIPDYSVPHRVMQSGTGISLYRTGAVVFAEIGGIALPSVSLDTNEHVFAIRTNGTNLHELLVDGVVVSSSTVAGVVQPTAPLYLGSNAGTSQFLDNHLSGVKIYARAISDRETML